MANIKNLNINSYRLNYNCGPDEHQLALDQLFNYNNYANKFGHRQRINLFYKLVNELIAKKIIVKTEKALDIGCNCGYYSNMISQFGFKNVKGIDIGKDMIEMAVQNFKRPGLDFKVENAEELDPAESADFILCTEVIEHTHHPEKVIENIKRVLNVNGIAVITLPNAFSLPYFFIRLAYTLKGKHKDSEYRDHLKYPFYKTLKLFKADNIEIVKTSGTNCFYFNFLEKLPFFNFFSRLNFHISYRWPFKYFSQFFFIVIRKTS